MSILRSASPIARCAYNSTAAINPRQNPTSAIEAFRTHGSSAQSAAIATTIARYTLVTRASGSVGILVIPQVVAALPSLTEPGSQSRNAERQEALNLLAYE